jgi:HlyD family secretion protein
MKKKFVIGIIVLVVAVGAILGVTLLKNNKSGLVKYKLDKITKGDIEAVVTTTGTVNPIKQVEVGSQVSGKISKMYVDFNSQVKASEIMAELDPLPFQARVAQNQANYMSALASLEKAKVTLENLRAKNDRSLALAEKDLISPDEKELAQANYLSAKTDLQRAEASVAQAKSQLDSSNLDLSYTIIRAPIDGFVISRNMEAGQTVQASFSAPKIFVLANDLTKMQVECDVDEADVGRIKEGQTVRFTVDAFPETTFNGKVNQVRFSPTVTQNVVTYTTVVDVNNPELKLRPGMTATVSIITGEAKGVLRVANAALRFTPTLPPEELAKIMKAAGEKMFAKRQAEGGGAPAAEGGRQQTAAQGTPANQATPGAQSVQGGQAAPGGTPRMNFGQGGGQGMPGGGGQRSGRRPSVVWYLDAVGKLNVAFIRPGVTDNTYTEILRGDLKEGQEIITGTQTAQTASTTTPGGPPRGGMMIMR